MRLQDDDGCDCANCRELRAFVVTCGGKDKAMAAMKSLAEQMTKVLEGVPVMVAAGALGVYLERNPEVAMYGLAFQLQRAQDVVLGAAVSIMPPAGSA
jgi:hypothetical protein